MSKFKFVKKTKPVEKVVSKPATKVLLKKPLIKVVKKAAPQIKTYKEHKAEWGDCNNCSLCSTRQNVIFLRGSIPCDVLFVGEAPGFSEDVIGKPMVGPAGKLMDHIIQRSLEATAPSDGLKWAITNLVSCIPLGDNGSKTEEPPEEAIEACLEKLYELITIAKPKAIIFVGKLSAKHVSPIEVKLTPNQPEISEACQFTSIDHPAFILRSDVSFQELLIQRAVASVSDVFSEILLPF